MNFLNINKIKLICLTVLFLLPLSLFSFDWGLLADQDFSIENVVDSDSNPDIIYSATLLPWFSAPIRDGDLYLSLGVTAKYEGEKWFFIPELFQTDFTYNFADLEFRVGRMRYSDPMGIIAEGLFDGLSLAYDTSIGNFSAGVWYTGFLFKKTANITMTTDDLSAYNTEFSYDKFWDTYFSSRRILAAVGWEHYGLGELVRLKVSLLNQADVNGRDTWYHSQYLAAQAGIPILNYFVLDLGGSLSFSEVPDDFDIGLIGELGFAYFLPTSFQDRLRISGIFSSGKSDALGPFIPVTTVSQGDVLGAKISGLSKICLDYTARLHRTFSFSVSSAYFVLSDKVTYEGWPGEKEGYFLGNEFFGRLIWSPVSDLQLNLGGGLFIPAMGNAAPDEKPRWKVEISAQLAIF